MSSHTVGSTAPSLKQLRFFFKWLNVEDGTDVLSWNVGSSYQPRCATAQSPPNIYGIIFVINKVQFAHKYYETVKNFVIRSADGDKK